MNRMCGMCLNWKVVAGLATIGIAIYGFAPNLVGAALPLLAVAVCPLSMLAMMWGMSRMGGMQGSGCTTQERRLRTGIDGADASQGRTGQLRQELRDLEAREAAIRAEVAELEGTDSRHRSETLTPLPAETQQGSRGPGLSSSPR